MNMGYRQALLVCGLRIIPPLIPGVMAFLMTSVRYDRGAMPPRKLYLWLTLIHLWFVLVAYWLFGLLVMYGVWLTMMLTVRKYDAQTFGHVFDAALSPWRSSDGWVHAMALLLPIALSGVLLQQRAWKQRSTREFVARDVRFVLLLMMLFASAVYAIGILCA